MNKEFSILVNHRTLEEAEPMSPTMQSTSNAGRSLSDVLASAGKLSFQDSLWPKVRETVNAEHERFSREEKALSPTPAQLRRHFSL